MVDSNYCCVHGCQLRERIVSEIGVNDSNTCYLKLYPSFLVKIYTQEKIANHKCTRDFPHSKTLVCHDNSRITFIYNLGTFLILIHLRLFNFLLILERCKQKLMLYLCALDNLRSMLNILKEHFQVDDFGLRFKNIQYLLTHLPSCESRRD